MEQTKVPALRFRQEDGTEFPAWERKPFGNLYKRNSERNSNKIPYDKTISIAKMQYNPEGNGASIDSLNTYKVLRVGDIAYEGHENKNFQFGRFVLNDIGDGIISPRFMALRPLKNLPVNFWKNYIHREATMNRVLVHATKKGTMMNELVVPEFLKQTIFVPSIQEQYKIGDFLSKLDHRIFLADKKLVTLQTIKKGMLQKIFSQELRFKDDDGNEFPAWKVKKLGDICQVNPKSPRLDDKFYYIDLDSVTNGQLSLKAPIQKDNAPSRAQRVVQLGDVLFQMVRPYQLNHYLVNKKFDLQTVASTGFAQLRCKENDSKFVYQILFTENFNHKVLVRCIGTGYPAINANDLSEIQTAIPSLPEQRKISDYFTALDDAIAAAQKKASALRAIKKGLLQKMFV